MGVKESMPIVDPNTKQHPKFKFNFMDGNESMPIVDPNTKQHPKFKFFITIEDNETIFIKLTNEAKEFFEANRNNKIKLLVMAGKTGVGKSTLLNLVCKRFMYNNYEGYFPQIFKTGQECTSETILFDFLLNPIEIQKEKYYLIDAEGFDGIFNNIQHERRRELVEKVFSLMIFLSDIFILNWNNRTEQNHLEIYEKLINDAKKLMELETPKDFKINEDLFNDTIIFFRDKVSILDKETKILSKRGFDNVFPIHEIPESFRDDFLFLENDKTLIKCQDSVNFAFSKIIQQYINNKRRNIFFDFQKLELYLEFINNSMKPNISRNLNYELIFLCLQVNNSYLYIRDNNSKKDGYPNILTEKTKIFYNEFIFRILLNRTDAVKNLIIGQDELDVVRKNAYSNYFKYNKNHKNYYDHIHDDKSIEKIILKNYKFQLLIDRINHFFEKRKCKYLPFNYSICYELEMNPQLIEENIPDFIKSKENGKDF